MRVPRPDIGGGGIDPSESKSARCRAQLRGLHQRPAGSSWSACAQALGEKDAAVVRRLRLRRRLVRLRAGVRWRRAFLAQGGRWLKNGWGAARNAGLGHPGFTWFHQS